MSKLIPFVVRFYGLNHINDCELLTKFLNFIIRVLFLISSIYWFAFDFSNIGIFGNNSTINRSQFFFTIFFIVKRLISVLIIIVITCKYKQIKQIEATILSHITNDGQKLQLSRYSLLLSLLCVCIAIINFSVTVTQAFRNSSIYTFGTGLPKNNIRIIIKILTEVGHTLFTFDPIVIALFLYINVNLGLNIHR